MRERERGRDRGNWHRKGKDNVFNSWASVVKCQIVPWSATANGPFPFSFYCLLSFCLSSLNRSPSALCSSGLFPVISHLFICSWLIEFVFPLSSSSSLHTAVHFCRPQGNACGSKQSASLCVCGIDKITPLRTPCNKRHNASNSCTCMCATELCVKSWFPEFSIAVYALMCCVWILMTVCTVPLNHAAFSHLICPCVCMCVCVIVYTQTSVFVCAWALWGVLFGLVSMSWNHFEVIIIVQRSVQWVIEK